MIEFPEDDRIVSIKNDILHIEGEIHTRGGMHE